MAREAERSDVPGAAAGPGESGIFDDRPTGDVIASLLANVQALLRTQLELAKLELSQIAREKAVALVSLLLAGVLGLFILAFVGVTAAVALQLVLDAWLAWLLVTVLYTLLAAVGVFVGVRLLKRSLLPERTKQELERTTNWAKEQVQR